MGSIVGSFALSHILMAPDGVEESAERVFNGMQEVGRRVQAAKPDVLVVISSDHMFNINETMQIPICVGVADEWTPFGDLQTGTEPFPGHRALAEQFVESANHSGFDIAKVQGIRPDHGVVLPTIFADPSRKTPVVPILINSNMQPMPDPQRIYRLGGILKDVIEQHRPADERVAVIGTGGLSHWLFVPGMGNVNAEFDRHFLAEMAAGRAEQLAKMSAAEILEHSGNGGMELVTWLMAAATTPGKRGEAVFYEPMAKWSTGMGGVAIAA